MIQTDLTKLKPALYNRAIAAIEEMRQDKELRNLGVTGIIVSEALREVSVQMAYRSRLLYTEVSGALGVAMANALKPVIVRYVKAMYKAAGLYAIADADAIVPNTWTLESKHIVGEAVDLAPAKEGRAWWKAPEAVWLRMGAIGESHGMAWGGRWKNHDTPHFEI